jgi:serine/threonine protein kinase
MRELGSGTYGNVYSGYDHEFQRYVAVKKFKEMNDGNLGVNMLVIREISLLRQLNHPNVIKSLDILMGNKFSKDSLLVIMVISWNISCL